jgi:hypothetical protein
MFRPKWPSSDITTTLPRSLQDHYIRNTTVLNLQRLASSNIALVSAIEIPTGDLYGTGNIDRIGFPETQNL